MPRYEPRTCRVCVWVRTVEWVVKHTKKIVVSIQTTFIVSALSPALPLDRIGAARLSAHHSMFAALRIRKKRKKWWKFGFNNMPPRISFSCLLLWAILFRRRHLFFSLFLLVVHHLCACCFRCAAVGVDNLSQIKFIVSEQITWLSGNPSVAFRLR